MSFLYACMYICMSLINSGFVIIRTKIIIKKWHCSCRDGARTKGGVIRWTIELETKWLLVFFFFFYSRERLFCIIGQLRIRLIYAPPQKKIRGYRRRLWQNSLISVLGRSNRNVMYPGGVDGFLRNEPELATGGGPSSRPSTRLRWSCLPACLSTRIQRRVLSGLGCLRCIRH